MTEILELAELWFNLGWGLGSVLVAWIWKHLLSLQWKLHYLMFLVKECLGSLLKESNPLFDTQTMQFCLLVVYVWE